MGKKKILFATPTNTSGGAERVMTSLINYIDEYGYDVVYVNFDKNSSFYKINPRVKVVKLNIGFGNISKLKKLVFSPIVEVKRFIRVRKLLKEEKPDAVVAFLKTSEIIFGINALNLKIPFVTSIRNDLSAYKGVLNIFRKFAFPKASLVICQTKAVERSLREKISCNTVVLPNPISPDAVSEYNFFGRERKKKILAVGRLCEQKNFVLLIEALSLTYKAYPEVRNYSIEIYGEGPDREILQELIEARHLNNVTLCGVVPNALAVNNDAALYIMSSNYEGFPNTLIEAMANGIPSISTDFSTGAARELIGNNNENGILVPVGDVTALSNSIVYMLNHAEEAEYKAQRALEKAGEYEKNTVCKRWLYEIEHVIC